MDISTAIDQLTKLKKISKMFGECNVVKIDGNSFTLKVSIRNQDEEKRSKEAALATEHKPVLGFAEKRFK